MEHLECPAPVVENIYVKKRNLRDLLEWDPAIVEDPDVQDLIQQVLDEFKDVPNCPINKHALYDYMMLCDLDKEKFLDHLEMDHVDFRRYIQRLLKNKKQ